MSTLTVKISLGDDIRRIQVSSETASDYEKFLSLICSTFNLEPSNFEPSQLRLQWTDADGDAVSFSSTDEMKEAFVSLTPGVVRLRIVGSVAPPCSRSDDEPSAPSSSSLNLTLPQTENPFMELLDDEAPRVPRVDPAVPFADDYKVLVSGDGVYSSVLTQSNIIANNAKYYVIQLLTNNEGTKFFTWNHWGRAGLAGQKKLSHFDDNFHAALKDFTRKFMDKTKNEWASRDKFVAFAGKYTYHPNAEPDEFSGPALMDELLPVGGCRISSPSDERVSESEHVARPQETPSSPPPSTTNAPDQGTPPPRPLLFPPLVTSFFSQLLPQPLTADNMPPPPPPPPPPHMPNPQDALSFEQFVAQAAASALQTSNVINTTVLPMIQSTLTQLFQQNPSLLTNMQMPPPPPPPPSSAPPPPSSSRDDFKNPVPSSQEQLDKPLHQFVICDGCQGKVRGIRYKCAVCPNYDLCEACEAVGVHDEHEMLRIKLPRVNYPPSNAKQNPQQQQQKQQQQPQRQMWGFEAPPFHLPPPPFHLPPPPPPQVRKVEPRVQWAEELYVLRAMGFTQQSEENLIRMLEAANGDIDSVVEFICKHNY